MNEPINETLSEFRYDKLYPSSATTDESIRVPLQTFLTRSHGGMRVPSWLAKASPLIGRLPNLSREMLLADLIGGCIVAIMLVPQAMAYAMLAGLPPQVGLYASIAPLVLYAFFGSSKSLALGPVAIISLLVLSGISGLASPGSPEYIRLCLTLALMVGAMQLLMSVFRLGFLVNFISHPVLLGFTSAAALIIGFSQFEHLLGVKPQDSEYPIEAIVRSLQAIPQANVVTLAIGVMAIAILLFSSKLAGPLLLRCGAPKAFAQTISKFGPLLVVALASTAIAGWGLDERHQVKIVGEIPSGLPGWTWPLFGLQEFVTLFPLAVIITLVGFLESYSVAKALASRSREKIDANKELFGLGMADIAAAFTGGYPVTGGFSRSIVCHSAGVQSSLSGIFTAAIVALVVLFAAPLFYFVPKSVLAAIIMVAVVSLIDVTTPFQLWRYSRHDAIALVATFAAVLLLGIEKGIFVGIGSTAILLMWRVSRPHIAEVGRVSGTEHFRNVLRHRVETYPHALIFRFDASLTFATAPYLENYILEQIADRPGVRKILLIAAGINEIDATGIETLENIRRELKAAGVDFYLSDVKGPVSDRLRRAAFDPEFLSDHLLLSAHHAFPAIAEPPVDTLPAARVGS